LITVTGGALPIGETTAIAIAASSSFFTSGSSSVAAPFSSTTCRMPAPPPFNRFAGSGSFVPCMKNKLTQRGYSAIEQITSRTRPVGEYPIASAL
jgi:hypothetical protein